MNRRAFLRRRARQRRHHLNGPSHGAKRRARAADTVRRLRPTNILAMMREATAVIGRAFGAFQPITSVMNSIMQGWENFVVSIPAKRAMLGLVPL